MPLEDRREALAALFEDEHPAVQKVANAAMERVDALASYDLLLKELKSGDTATQVQAIYGLGKIPGTRALKIIIQAIRHPKVGVACAAARVLADLRDPRVGKPMLDALPEVDSQVQVILMEALGQLRERRAAPVILRLLPDLEGDGLERAIQALGRIGEPDAETALIGLIHDDNPRIRAAAALALGSLGLE